MYENEEKIEALIRQLQADAGHIRETCLGVPDHSWPSLAQTMATGDYGANQGYWWDTGGKNGEEVGFGDGDTNRSTGDGRIRYHDYQDAEKRRW